MRPLYRPGRGLLRRAPAGAKLLALAVVALLLSLLPLGVAGSLVAVGAASALYPLTGEPWRHLLIAWWRLRWLVLLLGIALGVLVSVETAIVNTGRVVTLLLLAGVVTATTRTTDLMDVIRRALSPLRPLGVDPEAVALTLSLTIATVPALGSFVAQIREAQAARGTRLGPCLFVPLLVMTMTHADEVGEALAARGVGS